MCFLNGRSRFRWGLQQPLDIIIHCFPGKIKTLNSLSLYPPPRLLSSLSLFFLSHCLSPSLCLGFLFFVSMRSPLSCHPQSGFEKERKKERKRLILTGLPQLGMARRRGLQRCRRSPPLSGGVFPLKRVSPGTRASLRRGSGAGCQPPAACPLPQYRPCFGRSVCSLLMGSCVLQDVGETRLRWGLIDTPEIDPSSSAFLSFALSFPLSFPSLPSSLLSETLVLISAAVWTPRFRSAN